MIIKFIIYINTKKSYEKLSFYVLKELTITLLTLLNLLTTEKLMIIKLIIYINTKKLYERLFFLCIKNILSYIISIT